MGNPHSRPDLKPSYDMGHARRGKAIIFNQKVFKCAKQGPTVAIADQHHPNCECKHRKGTDEDFRRLNMTLTNLGFVVVHEKDLTLDHIKDKLKDLKKEDHSDADCVLVAVLTHGGKDNLGHDILSASDKVDDRLYRPEMLMKYFLSIDGLNGKPKIFLVQACRGDKEDKGNPSRSRDYIKSGSGPAKIPQNGDFLIYKSTPEEYVSWRSETNGSYFIRHFCDVLDETVVRGEFSEDLLSLLTRVNGRVAEEEMTVESASDPNKTETVKQIPEITSRLTKAIYFNKK